MLQKFVDSLQKNLSDYVQYSYYTESIPAEFRDWPDWIHKRVITSFQVQLGIDRLYSHQSEALTHYQQGENIILSTATASGKSLVYQVPILQSYLVDPDATTLLLYPTKALARDQFTKLVNLRSQITTDDALFFEAPYDGDTPSSIRSQIQDKARVIFSNPDMLHYSILPNHHKWSRFFQNLNLIVIEEVHQYNGIFGSHLSFIIQRLQRLCRHYSAKPQFIGTSASIQNPKEQMTALLQADVASITDDSSPKNKKVFLGFNPLVIDPEFHIREHPYNAIVKIARYLVQHQIQSIIFCSSRRSVEMLNQTLHDQIFEEDLNGRLIVPYRSGYTQSSRRDKESLIRSGDALITIATNALELGIDIEGIDTIITLGYPGSIASLQQQAGRAGRKHQLAAHIFVASQSPIDQYIINNPQWITSNPEHARINRNNLLLALPHIQANLYELPYDPTNPATRIDIPDAEDIIQFLHKNQSVQIIENKYYWMDEKRPHESISIRSTATEQFDLIDMSTIRKRKIGETDLNSAIWMTHPGAIYFHDGTQYLVRDFDSPGKKVLLAKTDASYMTKADTTHQVQIIDSQITASTQAFSITSGEIQVTTSVESYRKIAPQTNLVLERNPIEVPSTSIRTTALWINPTEFVIQSLDTPSNTIGKIDYGKDWDAIRHSIRIRDNFCCARCGSHETDQAHHVHHLKPIRNFDSLEEANRESNLVTLCPSCHRSAESAVRIRSPLGGLAYALQNVVPIYISSAQYDIIVSAITDQSCFNYNPTLLLFDNVPGGLGMSLSLMPEFPNILKTVKSTIANCKCKEGCPSCIGAPGEIGHGNKHSIIQLIEILQNNSL